MKTSCVTYSGVSVGLKGTKKGSGSSKWQGFQFGAVTGPAVLRKGEQSR